MPWVEPIARRAAWVTIAAAVIAFLSLAHQFVIPLALAILLAFLLSPIVRWLDKRLPSRVLAVSIACVVGGAVIVGISTVAVFQFVDFAQNLPGYRHTIAQKIITLRGTNEGVIGRALGAMSQIEEEVASATTTSPTTSAPPMLTPAMPVVTREHTGLLESTMALVEPIVEPLLMAAVVCVLVVLLLLYAEELRDRVLVLAGTQQISVTAQALEDASKRIGRYLLMQAGVNTFFGASIAVGLMAVGVPNALLLGLLAGALRFIPLLGAWLGAAVPVLLSMAVFDTWGPVWAVIGVFIAMEAVANFALEPFLYGHSTGISGIGVILAILFWTWIWGPIGLLLAVPITVCVVVMGKHIEPLRVFYILLSDEPMLAGERRLYHRLLSGDLVSAERLVRETIEKSDLSSTADELLIPVLQTTREDVIQGSLSEERYQLVADAMQDLVANADECKEQTEEHSHIVCVGAEPHDRPAAYVVAAAVACKVEGNITVLESPMQADVIAGVENAAAKTLILTSAASDSIARARLLAKAVHRRLPGLQIIIADLANASPDKTPNESLIILGSVRAIADRMEQVMRANDAVSPPRAAAEMPPGAAPLATGLGS